MENKLIATCHGDQVLFASVHGILNQNLPSEPVEWKRSYGRPRTVFLHGLFVPFSKEILQTDEKTLINGPFFHMYWTDCDNDAYKSKIKDDIAGWLSVLKENNILDWLIVIVNNEDGKKKLLPRMSVHDRVKSDFCNKFPDRCVILNDPLRNDSKSSESWQLMLQRTRLLFVQSIDRNVSKYEEHMRSQRERRNEPGWGFLQYFMLQEDLAFMLEMLGLFEESMIQYDELDALFTQFVVNHAAGDTAQWLTSFSQNITCWEGLNLSHTIDEVKRNLIKNNKASLLDFRNYLLSRQCSLLLLLNRPWEVASRSIPFIHNCVQEFNILDLSLPEGAIACWVFLSCREVLETCEHYNDSSEIENYSLFTASLWEYSRKKLKELGELCGLMPSCETTSAHLNTVVDLIAGLQHQSSSSRESEPCNKLREALSSKESFQKHYVESTELAMGTYKHIGRLRSARLIGKDLAEFYLQLGGHANAESFLVDAYKMYRIEGWHKLADHTRLEIAKCQKLQDNISRYVKSCIQLASSKTLAQNTKKQYSEELEQKSLEIESPLLLRLSTLYTLEKLVMNNRKVVVNDTVTVELKIFNKYPVPMVVDISIALKPISVDILNQSSKGLVEHLSSENIEEDDNRSRSSSICSITSSDVVLPPLPTPTLDEISIKEHVEMKDDNLLAMSSLDNNPPIVTFLQQETGPQMLRDKEITKDDYSFCLKDEKVKLPQGSGIVTLHGKAEKPCLFLMMQLCVKYNQLEFLRPLTDLHVTYNIVCDDPVLTIVPSTGNLFCGLPQQLILKVSSGSHFIEAGSVIRIDATDGLNVYNSKLCVPEMKPYQHFSDTIDVTAELSELLQIQHRMNATCDWSDEKHEVCFIFKRPFIFSNKLHTSGERKFIQIQIENQSQDSFTLHTPKLVSDLKSENIELTFLNKTDQTLVIGPSCTGSVLWSLKYNNEECASIHFTFTALYQYKDMSQPELTTYNFHVSNYQTLYFIKTTVVPPIGHDVCKAGQLCQYKVEVSPGSCRDVTTQNMRLMYEINCDPNIWIPNGKTTGVITECQFEVTVELMPLIGGFLPVPDVNLQKLFQHSDIECSSSEGDSVKAEQIILKQFHSGEIFNCSRAEQVHVLPGNTTSQIEVSAVL